MNKELLQQALDVLSSLYLDEDKWPIIDALRAELAKPEPEPVAWMHPTSHDCISAHRHVYANGIPLYRREDV
jgi:hypothetical protein